MSSSVKRAHASTTLEVPLCSCPRPLVLALAGPATPSVSAPSKLTNGCGVSARGIPSCGAYMGGAYGANANLASWRGSTAGPMACTAPTGDTTSPPPSGRRRPTSPRTASPGSASRPPTRRHPWPTARAMPGPGSWPPRCGPSRAPSGSPFTTSPRVTETSRRGRCRHASPRSRAKAPNLGYSIILMGYHELYGNAKYRLGKSGRRPRSMWPASTSTKVRHPRPERGEAVHQGLLPAHQPVGQADRRRLGPGRDRVQ